MSTRGQLRATGPGRGPLHASRVEAEDTGRLAGVAKGVLGDEGRARMAPEGPSVARAAKTRANNGTAKWAPSRKIEPAVEADSDDASESDADIESVKSGQSQVTLRRAPPDDAAKAPSRAPKAKTSLARPPPSKPFPQRKSNASDKVRKQLYELRRMQNDSKEIGESLDKLSGRISSHDGNSSARSKDSEATDSDSEFAFSARDKQPQQQDETEAPKHEAKGAERTVESLLASLEDDTMESENHDEGEGESQDPAKPSVKEDATAIPSADEIQAVPTAEERKVDVDPSSLAPDVVVERKTFVTLPLVSMPAPRDERAPGEEVVKKGEVEDEEDRDSKSEAQPNSGRASPTSPEAGRAPSMRRNKVAVGDAAVPGEPATVLGTAENKVPKLQFNLKASEARGNASQHRPSSTRAVQEASHSHTSAQDSRSRSARASRASIVAPVAAKTPTASVLGGYSDALMLPADEAEAVFPSKKLSARAKKVSSVVPVLEQVPDVPVADVVDCTEEKQSTPTAEEYQEPAPECVLLDESPPFQPVATSVLEGESSIEGQGMEEKKTEEEQPEEPEAESILAGAAPAPAKKVSFAADQEPPATMILEPTAEGRADKAPRIFRTRRIMPDPMADRVQSAPPSRPSAAKTKTDAQPGLMNERPSTAARHPNQRRVKRKPAHGWATEDNELSDLESESYESGLPAGEESDQDLEDSEAEEEPAAAAQAGDSWHAPAEWVFAYTEDGYAYYYNEATGVSQWEHPRTTDPHARIIEHDEQSEQQDGSWAHEAYGVTDYAPEVQHQSYSSSARWSREDLARLDSKRYDQAAIVVPRLNLAATTAGAWHGHHAAETSSYRSLGASANQYGKTPREMELEEQVRYHTARARWLEQEAYFSRQAEKAAAMRATQTARTQVQMAHRVRDEERRRSIMDMSFMSYSESAF